MSLAAGPAGPILVGPLLGECAPRSIVVAGPAQEADAVADLLADGAPPRPKVRRADRSPDGRSGGTPDCVLWSGDPNWHAAFHFLRALAAAARAEGVAFPLVLVDHVGWPYGRRDGYDDPQAIPLEARNASRRMGLRPSSQLPVPEGGLHGHRHNGVFVRGTRNGVLTAVEDFVAEEAEAGSRIRCATVPGYHALAILAGESSVAPGGRLAQLLDDPAAALARWGVARALACSEVAARRTTLDALQRATLTPAHTGEGLQDLPTPFASGHVLRDLLHWTLLSQRFHAQLLRAVDEILTEAAVPYALAEGTLLGALRHGGPIPHDDDMDLVVPAGDMDRMRAAVEAAGLAAVETGGWPQLGRTFVIHVRHPHVERCGYWPKSPALDVFPVTEGPHAMVRTGEMLPLVRRLFCDFTANVPARAEAVLARRFGPEWATECHVWQHGALPGVGRDGGTFPLTAYLEICEQEGYAPPTTLARDALRPREAV